MSDIDEGVVLSQGRFRVDRRRALEKMERFQLEDPHRYVLELLAAAAAVDPERVDIINDSDDFEIAFDAPALPGEELDGLFDHLWGEPKTSKLSMLQHIGLGVLGALGLAPKWVRVDAGDGDAAIRLDVKDPTETKHAPLSPPISGVRVHVRERLSTRTFAEALRLAFQEPIEAQLVRGAARRYPARLFINKQEVPRLEPPDVCALSWSGEIEGRRAELHFVPHELDSGVDIVRHGLVVGHLPLVFGRFGLTGFIRDDALRLNASRSEIVRDERWDACSDALHRHIYAWLAEAAPEPPDDPDEELRWRGRNGDMPFRATAGELRSALVRAAVEHLARGDKPLGGLADVPILEDLRHDRYSAAQLKALPAPPAVTTELILDPDWEGPLFSAADETLLRALCGDIRDATRVIQYLAEGRARRAQAQVAQPWFEDSRLQRRFSEDKLKGAISGPLPKQPSGTLVIRWSQSGRVVQSTRVSAPGLRLQVILDHPDLETNLSFTQVKSGAIYDRAMALAREEAVEFLAEMMRKGPIYGDSLEAAGLFIDFLNVALRGLSPKATRQDVLREVPEVLREVPALPRVRGEHLSLRELVCAEEHFWWLPSAPHPCPPNLADRVVVLPAALGEAWARRFPRVLQDGAETITARLERERRLALPRREAKLLLRKRHMITIDEPDLKGELAWSEPALAYLSPQRSSLLRAGVPVDALALPEVLSGAFGIVDWAEAPVSPAHDALLPDAAEQLQARLLPHLDRLALTLWSEEATELPPPVRDWLCSKRVRKAPPEAALERVIGRWTDGDAFSLGDLRRFAQTRQKGEARLVVVSNDPGALPGYDTTVIMLRGAQEVFEAWANKHIRSRDPDLAQSRHEMQQFMARAPWTRGAALASKVIDYADLKGEVFLPVSVGELGPARAIALWQDRVLATRLRAKELGAVVVVTGPGLKPTIKLDNVVDSGRLTGLLKRARRALPELIDDALAELPEGQAPQPAESWRRLLACVASSEWRLRDRQEVLERFEDLPLFPSLSGPVYTPKQLREAHEREQAIRWVPPTTPRSASDHAYYLLAFPQVREAASAWLRVTVRDGLEELEDWRAAQRRLATTRRVEATLSLPHAHVEAFEFGSPKDKRLPPHRGELGLGGLSMAASEPGIHLTPLHDGLPLQGVVLPFPIPLAGIVEGPGVTPDRALSEVNTGTRPWARLSEALVQQAHGWLERLVQTDLSREERRRLSRWALSYRPTGPAREVPLFPLVDGGFASLAELHRRQRSHQAVGVITQLPLGEESLQWPAADAPLLLEAEQLPALGELVTPRLLDDTLAQYRATPAPSYRPPPGLRLELKGFGAAELVLPYDTKPAPVPLRVGRLTLAELHFTRPVGVTGFIDDCTLPPTPFLDGVDGGLDGLYAAVTEASRRALSRIAELHPRWAQTEAVPLMRAALRHLCAGPKRLREVAAGDAEGLEGQLAALQLFQRSDGVPGSLIELCQGDRIRAVSMSAMGRALPGQPPFWRVSGDERRWLSSAFQVVLSDGDLAAEERGVARRSAPAFDRSSPIWVNRQLRRNEDGVRATFWLRDPEETTISVLVEGREVCALPSPLPGMQGWIEGPFEPNTDFTRAELTPAARELLEECALELMRQEASDIERDRLKAYRRLKLLLGRSTLRQPSRAAQLYGKLKLFVMADGSSATVKEVTEALRAKGKIWYAAPGSALNPDGRFTLALSKAELPLIESLVGGEKRLLSLSEAQLKQERKEAERAAKAAAAAARAERVARKAEAKSRAEVIAQHLGRWGRSASTAMDGGPVLDHWQDQGAPDWVMAAQPDSPTLLIAAWKVAADSGLSNEAELLLLGELAAALKEGEA